jgi:hypothetical protein
MESYKVVTYFTLGISIITYHALLFLSSQAP